MDIMLSVLPVLSVETPSEMIVVYRSSNVKSKCANLEIEKYL